MLAARDLDAAVEELRAALPLGEPYADPGVGLFGLRNAVMPLGDTFVEVVSPVQDATAAGRFLDRRGDGAYMAMFQVEDLAGARARAAALGVREVWADRARRHLRRPPAPGGHRRGDRLARPAGAAASPGAGPARGSPHGELHTTGLTLSARDPEALGARWSEVLGGLDLEDGRVEVEPGAQDGIASFHVSGLDGEVSAAGARFVG